MLPRADFSFAFFAPTYSQLGWKKGKVCKIVSQLKKFVCKVLVLVNSIEICAVETQQVQWKDGKGVCMYIERFRKVHIRIVGLVFMQFTHSRIFANLNK